MKLNGKIKLPAPLFRDPIYDSPTDPVIVETDECFYMFYTQRRSSEFGIGVSTIHGTDIGIATSTDGARWLYRGVCEGLRFEHGTNTFWAPEIIFARGEYHMYCSYVRGVPVDWNWERHIVHYVSHDLWEWKFVSILPLSSSRVIDACVYEIEPGLYKMWYKNESGGSHTDAAISRDLYNWECVGSEITDCSHEGPNVFSFAGKNFMITDNWRGQAVYTSDDFTHWTRQPSMLLTSNGTRELDYGCGLHADVLLRGERAYIVYFTHPYRKGSPVADTSRDLRTAVQIAELHYDGEKLYCDRDDDVYFEN